jgi:hypothetical protein
VVTLVTSKCSIITVQFLYIAAITMDNFVITLQCMSNYNASPQLPQVPELYFYCPAITELLLLLFWLQKIGLILAIDYNILHELLFLLQLC